MNENQNTAHQIVGEGTSKPVLRGKFIALNTYLRKDQASGINYLNWEREEQNKPQRNKKMKIVKIRAEINEIEDRKTVE